MKTNLATKEEFYTDSNGRDFIKRVYLLWPIDIYIYICLIHHLLEYITYSGVSIISLSFLLSWFESQPPFKFK